jgi:hypothetical protein
VNPLALFGRIDEQLVFATESLTHINARLLPTWKEFAKEVSVASFLQGVVRFDCEKFLDALSNLFAFWGVVKIGASVASLLVNPFACPYRVLIFEPAKRIGHRYTVKYRCNRFNG